MAKLNLSEVEQMVMISQQGSMSNLSSDGKTQFESQLSQKLAEQLGHNSKAKGKNILYVNNLSDV